VALKETFLKARLVDFVLKKIRNILSVIVLRLGQYHGFLQERESFQLSRCKGSLVVNDVSRAMVADRCVPQDFEKV